MEYLATRLIQGFAVIATVLVVVFFAIRILGDPVDVLLPIDATDAARDNLRHQLGLDRNVLSQFGSFVGDAVQLRFGDSYTRHAPALPVVLARFPRTALLVIASITIAGVVGLALGALAAVRPNGVFDRACVTLSLLSASVPQFWLGLVLILLFSVNLGVLPSSGTGSLGHMVLPVLTLALPPAGRFAVLMRSALREELNAEYIRMDVARGVPLRGRVRHASRSVAVPMASVVGFELVYTFAGHSVVVETVFAWPGVGALVVESLTVRDLPLIQATIAFIAIVVVLINLLLDAIYLRIDPRIAQASRAVAGGAS